MRFKSIVGLTKGKRSDAIKLQNAFKNIADASDRYDSPKDLAKVLSDNSVIKEYNLKNNKPGKKFSVAGISITAFIECLKKFGEKSLAENEYDKICNNFLVNSADFVNLVNKGYCVSEKVVESIAKEMSKNFELADEGKGDFNNQLVNLVNNAYDEYDKSIAKGVKGRSTWVSSVLSDVNACKGVAALLIKIYHLWVKKDNKSPDSTEESTEKNSVSNENIPKTLEYNVKDSDIDYGIFNSKTKILGNLYPDGGFPKITDIRQGYTDLDCYFLSVVAGLVNKKPEYILRCFPEYCEEDKPCNLSNFMQAKVVKVRFFDSNKQAVNIIVDKTALRNKGAAWVRLLEKAFAVYVTKVKKISNSPEKGKNHKKIYSRIIDGIYDVNTQTVMRAITGSEQCDSGPLSKSENKKFSKEYSPDARGLYKKIKAALDANNVVTTDTRRDSFNFYKKGLFLQHAYTVTGVKEEDGIFYIIVRNPYANRSRRYKKDSKGKYHSEAYISEEKSKRGVSEIELNDFCNYFEDVEIFDVKDIKGLKSSETSTTQNEVMFDSRKKTSLPKISKNRKIPGPPKTPKPVNAIKAPPPPKMPVSLMDSKVPKS